MAITASSFTAILKPEIDAFLTASKNASVQAKAQVDTFLAQLAPEAAELAKTGNPNDLGFVRDRIVAKAYTVLADLSTNEQEAIAAMASVAIKVLITAAIAAV